MYSLESPRRGDSNKYTQYTFNCIKDRKDFPKLSPFASWLGTMINPQWLELPMSRTIFHGPKDVWAIEVWLYYDETKHMAQWHSEARGRTNMGSTTWLSRQKIVCNLTKIKESLSTVHWLKNELHISQRVLSIRKFYIYLPKWSLYWLFANVM